MVIRKRRTPSPDFRTPPPFNPMLGQHAGLPGPTNLTRLAFFQVCKEDTHDNYVVCRGLDPESGFFYDGEHGSISVAKPYGRRGSKDYKLAEVLVCAKCLNRLGENAGKAETSDGQPEDLEEKIVLLKDDDDKPICWIHLAEKSDTSFWAKIVSSEEMEAPSSGKWKYSVRKLKKQYTETDPHAGWVFGAEQSVEAYNMYEIIGQGVAPVADLTYVRVYVVGAEGTGEEEGETEYWFDALPLVRYEVMTDVQVDASNLELEKKAIKTFIIPAMPDLTEDLEEGDPEWQVWYTGYKCLAPPP